MQEQKRKMRSKLKDFLSPIRFFFKDYYFSFYIKNSWQRMTVESDTFSLRSQSLDNFTAMNHAAAPYKFRLYRNIS